MHFQAFGNLIIELIILLFVIEFDNFIIDFLTVCLYITK